MDLMDLAIILVIFFAIGGLLWLAILAKLFAAFRKTPKDNSVVRIFLAVLIIVMTAGPLSVLANQQYIERSRKDRREKSITQEFETVVNQIDYSILYPDVNQRKQALVFPGESIESPPNILYKVNNYVDSSGEAFVKNSEYLSVFEVLQSSKDERVASDNDPSDCIARSGLLGEIRCEEFYENEYGQIYKQSMIYFQLITEDSVFDVIHTSAFDDPGRHLNATKLFFESLEAVQMSDLRLEGTRWNYSAYIPYCFVEGQVIRCDE